jgi:hypothetical protein
MRNTEGLLKLYNIFKITSGITNMVNGRLLRWEQILYHLIFLTSTYRKMLKIKSCYHAQNHNGGGNNLLHNF